MPMRPRCGSAITLRHMKSWSSSYDVGCLNEWTSQPCGLTPSNTLLMALSSPASSLSRPPFSLVLCDLRWNVPDPSKRNGAMKGFSSALRDCDDFLLMTGDTLSSPLLLYAHLTNRFKPMRFDAGRRPTDRRAAVLRPTRT